MTADRVADDLSEEHGKGNLILEIRNRWRLALSLLSHLHLALVSLQMMRRFSTSTQRRTRVKVLGVVIPSPVVVAME